VPEDFDSIAERIAKRLKDREERTGNPPITPPSKPWVDISTINFVRLSQTIKSKANADVDGVKAKDHVAEAIADAFMVPVDLIRPLDRSGTAIQLQDRTVQEHLDRLAVTTGDDVLRRLHRLSRPVRRKRLRGGPKRMRLFACEICGEYGFQRMLYVYRHIRKVHWRARMKAARAVASLLQ